MHYLLLYDYASDYLERRSHFRTEHLRLAWASQERGEMVLGGAFEPPDGAAILFRCDSAAIPQAFADADPYVRNGLVTRYRIHAWTTVVGADATTPVRL